MHYSNTFLLPHHHIYHTFLCIFKTTKKERKKSSSSQKCIGMGTSSGRLPAAPKFFKIIMDPKADNLSIPAEFSKRIGHNLPNPIFLKVPNGPTTEIELNQCNGKTMLQKGWQEFKERYSIGFGQFLVFEYDGMSEFNVVIFDTTAVEVKYPFHADYKSVTDQGRRPKLEDDDGMESDDSVVLLEDFLTGNRGKDGSGRQKISHGKPKGGPVVKETCIAYQKAIAFASSHSRRHSFFISLLQQSYVSGRCGLNVPKSFLKRNLPCEGAISIIMVTDGKKWPVRCFVGDGRAKLSAGWKDFVQDNGLKVGDSCIFEVANYKSNKHVWNVVIFRS